MSDVIIPFGIFSVVVINDGFKIKSTFSNMCTALNINHWCLSCGNHQGIFVERYHRFMIKTQAIKGNDQGTKTIQCAWNSAAIDNTDVTACFGVIGQYFRFPLDVQLSPSPTLKNNENGNIYCYLRDVGTDSKFTIIVLQILIEERHISSRIKVNEETSMFAQGRRYS